MTIRGRRIFNHRPVCFFALFVAAGILLAEAFSCVPHAFRAIPLSVLAAVSVFMLIRRSSRRHAYLALAALIGFVACSGASDVFESGLASDGNGVFTARVSGDIVVEDGVAEFYVEALYADGEVRDGECLVTLELDGAPGFGAGDTVILEGELRARAHGPYDTFYAAAVVNRTPYTLRAVSAELYATGEPDLVLRIRLAVSKLFYEHMDEDASAIARALIIGDQRGIDDLLYGDIKASGLAHVLSVSGLHITALATAVYWLFRKLGLNAKIAYPIVLALTFFYVAVCDFVPAAVRAFLMTAVFNFASVFGFKRDALSALAFAAAAIMIFSPYSLMHVGFLLSVFSLLGIMLFADPMKKFLMKGADRVLRPAAENAAPSVGAVYAVNAVASGEVPEPLGKLVAAKEEEERAKEKRRRLPSPKEMLTRAVSYVAESSSVAVAANLTALPLGALFFGEVQTLFILSNIVILPYTMFIYIILLVITPIALLTGLHGIVAAGDALILPFTAFTRAVGGVSFASLDVGFSVAGVVCFFAALICLAPHVFLKRRERVCAVLTFATLFLVMTSIAALV